MKGNWQGPVLFVAGAVASSFVAAGLSHSDDCQYTQPVDYGSKARLLNTATAVQWHRPIGPFPVVAFRTDGEGVVRSQVAVNHLSLIHISCMMQKLALAAT